MRDHHPWKQTRQPDAKASVFDLSVPANELYEVEAELICRYADERSFGPGAKLQSDTVYPDRGDDRTQLSLTTPATASPEIAGKTLLTDR